MSNDDWYRRKQDQNAPRNTDAIKDARRREQERNRETDAADDARKARNASSSKTDPRTESRDDAGETMRDGAPDQNTAENAVGESPRRQVTIPELPARSAAAMAAAQTETGTVPSLDAAASETDAATTGMDPLAPAVASKLLGAEARGQAGGQAATGLTAGRAQANRAQGLSLEGLASQPARDPAANPEGSGLAQDTLPTLGGEAESPRRQSAPALPEARLPAAAAHEPRARTAEPVPAASAPTPQATTAQTAVSTHMAALQPVAAVDIAAREKSGSAFTLEGEAEGLRFDLRGSSATGSTQFASTVAATARSGVAAQIAEMVRTMGDRPLDVALNPEELGRVRLSISTGEGGVTLQVLAERPETLELMRRHADQLARELADLGFASIDLAFGQGRDPDGDASDEGNRGSGHGPKGETEEAAAETRPANRLTLDASGGLDIRI